MRLTQRAILTALLSALALAGSGSLNESQALELPSFTQYGWDWSGWEGRACQPNWSSNTCMTAGARHVVVRNFGSLFQSYEAVRLRNVIDEINAAQDNMSVATFSNGDSLDLYFETANIYDDEVEFSNLLYLPDVMHVACMSWTNSSEEFSANYYRCNLHQAEIDWNAIYLWIEARAVAQAYTEAETLAWFAEVYEHVIAHAVYRAMGVGSSGCVQSGDYRSSCLADTILDHSAQGLSFYLTDVDWSVGATNEVLLQ